VIVEALDQKHDALSALSSGVLKGPKDRRALGTSPVRILSRRKTVQKYSVVHRIAA
jgi:hypothetical protein